MAKCPQTTSDERPIAFKVAPECRSLSTELPAAFPNADPGQFVRDGAGPLLLNLPELVRWQRDKSGTVTPRKAHNLIGVPQGKRRVVCAARRAAQATGKMVTTLVEVEGPAQMEGQ
jgi:hypothetical protein